MEEAIKEAVGNRSKAEMDDLTLDGKVSSTIQGLTDEFTGLTTLSLNNMRLASLDGLPRLPKLLKLELNDNRLVGGLDIVADKCPRLQFLSLMNNRLKDPEVLRPLARLKGLQVVDLMRNDDLCSQPSYPELVFDMLPSIVYCDGRDRDNNEMPEEEDSRDSDEDDYEDDMSGGEDDGTGYDNEDFDEGEDDEDDEEGESQSESAQDGENGKDSRNGESEGDSDEEEEDLAKALEEGVEQGDDEQDESTGVHGSKRQRIA